MVNPANDPVASHLHWVAEPQTDAPVLIAAFSGWNDAADAATTAVQHLGRRWQARTVATIDPEPFFDFSSTRPLVRLDESGEREIVWPGNDILFAQPGRDALLLDGIEPQLQWRTFCAEIVALAQRLGVDMVVTLGALLAEVPHSRPVVVYGSTEDPDVAERLALAPSDYEGPTGIVGALHAACRDAGIASASLWAAVPTYLSGATSPKAALALVERLGRLLSVPVPVTDLQIAASAYERQVNELVSSDTDLAAYVTQIEEHYDDGAYDDVAYDDGAHDDNEIDDDHDDLAVALEEEPDADALMAEVERFLRDQE